MKRNYFTIFFRRNILAAFTFFLIHESFANDTIRMGEDYYGNNIEAAVLEAQQNNRKVSYNNKYWYNRTTSRSFSLPPLNPQELEQSQLDGALLPTASGGNLEENESETFLLEKRKLELNQNEVINNQENIQASEQTIPQEKPLYYVPFISHEFTRGDKVETRGILSNSTIISTPRPD